MAVLLNLEAIFVLYIISRMFPGKALKWFYYECYHGEGSMFGIGGIIKNVLFSKTISRYVIVNTPSEFPNARRSLF